MNKTRSVVVYSAIRVVLFAAIFTVLMLLDIVWWISALLAALIALCISYIFLSRARDEVSRSLYEVRHREREPVREDDEVEDATLDRLESEGLQHEQEPDHEHLDEHDNAHELKQDGPDSGLR